MERVSFRVLVGDEFREMLVRKVHVLISSNGFTKFEGLNFYLAQILL